MKSNVESFEEVLQSLDNLVLTINMTESLSHLHHLYDAFIRDEVSGNFSHEERLKIHQTYRALEIFMKELEAN